MITYKATKRGNLLVKLNDGSIGRFVQGGEGLFYFEASRTYGRVWGSDTLREIADALDRINRGIEVGKVKVSP